MDYNVDEFVEHHNGIHKCYCEAIVRPNGQITYAEPSHLMKLQEMWGVPKEQLFTGGKMRDRLCSEMPMTASPVHWLSEVLNCVILWYNAIIFPPNYTKNQIQSVKKLIANGCVDKNPSLEVTMEYQICQDDNRTANQLKLICKHKELLLNQIADELQIKATITIPYDQ